MPPAPFKAPENSQQTEILPLGIPMEWTLQKPASISSKTADWRTLINGADVVLLDNRNSFEYRLAVFQVQSTRLSSFP